MPNQPFFYPAALFGLLAIPLILEVVPKNRFYGIRTARTLADKEAWYRANRFGGWLFLVSSAVYLVFAASRPMAGPRDPRFTLWLAHLAMFLLPLLVSVIATLRYVRRL
jgi:uncharacterized membrane protein